MFSDYGGLGCDTVTPDTNISKQHAGFIFRVAVWGVEKLSGSIGRLPRRLLLGSQEGMRGLSLIRGNRNGYQECVTFSGPLQTGNSKMRRWTFEGCMLLLSKEEHTVLQKMTLRRALLLEFLIYK